MLSDKHMYAKKQQLQKKFPHLQGLQSTLLSQTGKFQPVVESGAAIQIRFVSECHHWVATSYDDGEVKQYDSLFQGKLTPSLEHQIAQLYSCAAQNGMIKVKAVPMQQQTGSTDCGLFSIAAAVHVALGDSMADTSFAQEKLRDHLIH